MPTQIMGTYNSTGSFFFFWAFLLLLFFLFWLDQVTTAEYPPLNACPTLALCTCLVKFVFWCHHCECTIFYSSFLSLFLVNLLAGKCSRAIKGRGALVFWSNPLTQTNPANSFQKILISVFLKIVYAMSRGGKKNNNNLMHVSMV